MVQHLLLTLVAAPLLLLSNSMPVLLWALPPPERATVGRLVGQTRSTSLGAALADRPLVAGIAVRRDAVAWHLPLLYEWALENRWAHYFEHVIFFVTAILFWWPVIGAAPLRSPLGYPARMAYTFLAGCRTACWAPASACRAARCTPTTSPPPSSNGIDPLFDQQLAGLIMWVPGDMLFAVDPDAPVRRLHAQRRTRGGAHRPRTGRPRRRRHRSEQPN